MTIDFTATLTLANGQPMRKPKEKTDAQFAEEKAIAKSGKSREEIGRELEVTALKYLELEEITLSFVVGEALLNPIKGEDDVTGAEMYDRRKLAKRVYNNAQDITAVEKEKIKTLVAKMYQHNPQVVGAAYELLDG